MKIEELVPPLELCQQIPEGEFSDSALDKERAIQRQIGRKECVR